MKPNQSNYLVPAIAVLAFSLSGVLADPVGSAFAYQGRLNDGGQPAGGSYDVKFALYAAPSPSGGAQIGAAITNLNLVVSNGLFNVTIDFGADAFNGDARWLQIGVRTNGSTADFQLLTPLQALQPQPYALYTIKAGTATVASNLVAGTYSRALNLNNPGNTVVGTFTGSGGGLTGLNPANLSSGTAAINISGNAATADTALTANNFSGLLAGDVTGPQGATVVANVGGQSAAQVASGASAANAASPANTPGTLVRRDSAGNFTAGAIIAASLSGDGSGLSALNASQLASGTLTDARLSANVALLNAPQTFSGSNVFSGVVQLTNTNNAFVGAFAGNGGGLSNLSMSAANVLGPLPASQLSGTLPSGLLAGGYSNPLAFNNPANRFTGDGSGLANLKAATLGGLSAASFWQLGGNAGTTAGVNFLGTVDNQPLELKVNGVRTLRLEPNGSGAPNVIAGSPLNFVNTGTVGSVIGGGGATSYNGSAYTNEVASDFGTIGGGLGNSISTNSPGSTIGGGSQNLITYYGDPPYWINPSYYATIGGGCFNIVSGTNSTVAGGSSNSVFGVDGFIGGGTQNFINDGSGYYAGGTNTISGGGNNGITGGLLGADCDTIAGGSGNRILEDTTGDTISGGIGNGMGSESFYNTIGGGAGNSVNGNAETIAGGNLNVINNFMTGGCAIGGGTANNISYSVGATISGGQFNSIIRNSDYATISGGLSNSVSGDFGTIPGGQSNFATTNAFAAGYRAKATQSGSFVWADSTDVDYNPYALPAPGGDSNSFNVRATGGCCFVTAVDGTTGKPTAGVYVSAGGSGWNTYSDRNAKTNLVALDGREILSRLDQVPIYAWNYKTQDAAVRHLGPMAQDFNAAFEVGENNKAGEKRYINSLDADGVALAAIQGLNEVVKEKDAEIKELKQAVSELRTLVNTLAQRSNGGGE